jgi:hypothetical protein
MSVVPLAPGDDVDVAWRLLAGGERGHRVVLEVGQDRLRAQQHHVVQRQEVGEDRRVGARMEH